MIVRPSGTEPKLKCYLEVVIPGPRFARRRPDAARSPLLAWARWAPTYAPASGSDLPAVGNWLAGDLCWLDDHSDGTSRTFSDVTACDATLRRFLHGLPAVDKVGADARAARLGTRSIKTTAKAYAIDLAIRMVDLTTLEGQDTAGKVRGSGQQGDASRTRATPRAQPRRHSACTATWSGSRRLRSPARRSTWPPWRRPSPVVGAALEIKLADTRDAVAAGADEIDMVIDRGAFLTGRYLQVFDEIVAVRAACQRPDGREAHLKVIFETGELQTYDNVRRVSWLAMMAGAHFIKTSTGKISPAATLPVTMIMLEAVRDFRDATGQMIGVKPAGGIRTSKDAIKYLVTVNEIAGPDWLDPDWFRFGASTLLNDLLMQRTKIATGRYSGPDYVTLD